MSGTVNDRRVTPDRAVTTEHDQYRPRALESTETGTIVGAGLRRTVTRIDGEVVSAADPGRRRGR